VLQLLSSDNTDHRHHNLRSAFVAGLAYSLDKQLLILQDGYSPVPSDCRDFVSPYKTPDDINSHINELAPTIMEMLLASDDSPSPLPTGLLAALDLGSPAAENEVTTLGRYFLPTNEFTQIIHHTARLSVGRKGSGKTALFFQARDKLRVDKQRIILDLKPEGHQLKRLKELVLRFLTEPTQEHLATAFWEYVLLLELCYKILDKDRQLHVRDHTLYEPYQELAKLYARDFRFDEADFSERMLQVVTRIISDFSTHLAKTPVTSLTPTQVTQLVFTQDIPELTRLVTAYCEHKHEVVLLVDNLDKGWPSRGLDLSDIIILRSLLDATRKLERAFQKRRLLFHTTVFIRNDVYEILVDQSPDRGKESRVQLDWTDPDLLREFLRRRLVHNQESDDATFTQAWLAISTSHVKGQESSEFLVERSLMRPRSLLTLVNYAKSNAVNLQHQKITEDDLLKAASTFSADLATDIGLEIRDVHPKAADVLYCFISAPARLSLEAVHNALSPLELSPSESESVIELLLWFGFLGVLTQATPEPHVAYIYTEYYDIKKLKRLAGDLHSPTTLLEIHPAFWPFLDITDTDSSP
jgi:hypothetical protein